jgi:hypothetical protein
MEKMELEETCVKGKKFILLAQESHLHLGLFKDLEGLPNVEIAPIKQKVIKNPVLKALKRVHCSWSINTYKTSITKKLV